MTVTLEKDSPVWTEFVVDVVVEVVPKIEFPPLLLLYVMLLETVVLFDCEIIQSVELFTLTVLLDPAPFPEILIFTPLPGVPLGTGVGDDEGLTLPDGIGEGEEELLGEPDGSGEAVDEGLGKIAAAVKVLFKEEALAEKSPNTLWLATTKVSTISPENKK